MYEFQTELLHGLPVANIRLVQSADPEDTPAVNFLRYLRHGKMPVSMGLETYFHDVEAHWLGAASLEKHNFGAFLSLYDNRECITLGDPEQEKQFIVSLASGFDISTGSILDRCTSKYFDNDFASLSHLYPLAWSLREITSRCSPEVAKRSVAAVEEMRMGTPIPDPGENYTNFIVPWEVNNLPQHYKQVTRRLREVKV